MDFKIINWNVERPNKNKAGLIFEKLAEVEGDILILTETNNLFLPQTNFNQVSTDLLPQHFDGITYQIGENRTSIWTKFPITKQYKTCDRYTSLFADIKTPFGLLSVYATIIGVFGGQGQRFQDDLQGQLLDFNRLFPGKQVCLIGDYNIQFSGFAYPSHLARQTMNTVFQKYILTNLTASVPGCVDHIAISNEFLKGKKVTFDIWNEDKKLSDHKGTSITLTN